MSVTAHEVFGHSISLSLFRQLPSAWSEDAVEFFQRETRNCPGVHLQPRAASPVMAADGGLSLPAEIFFDETACDSAVSRARSLRRSMSQKLREKGLAVLLMGAEEEEELFEEEEEEEELKGGTDAEIRSPNGSGKSSFSRMDLSADDKFDEGEEVKRWLPPVIPKANTFMARLTFVSPLGQLYVQNSEDKVKKCNSVTRYDTC